MGAEEQIVRAAFRLFLAHGYDGTGVNDILGEAGLSKGAFYHHFPGKHELYETVIERYLSSPLTGMDWPSHEALGARAQRRAICARYREIVEASASMGADMTRFFALFFESLARLDRYRTRINADYVRIIDCLASALQREEELGPAVARSRARRFVAGLEGALYLWAVMGTVPDFSEDE